MNKNEFFNALSEIEKEKKIDQACLMEKIKNAMIIATKKEFGNIENIFVTIDKQENKFEIEIGKKVVEKVENNPNEISLEQAKKISNSAKVGDLIKIKIDTQKVGRIAAQGAKQVVRQGIKEAEREKLYAELKNKEGEIITAQVLHIEDTKRNFIFIKIGEYETIFPRAEQLPYEKLKEGDMIKLYISEVSHSDNGPNVIFSRTSDSFIKKLFELEIPEIANGVVKIVNIAYEAGVKAKIAVTSDKKNIDPIGTCIGRKGIRINEISQQAVCKKIDLIKYSEEPTKFIEAALKPAEVEEVIITDQKNKYCKVIIKPSQISLAVGSRGQNVKLAAKLTGYKINITAENNTETELKESDNNNNKEA